LEVRVPGKPPEWVAEASGFLYGDPMDKETDPAKHKPARYRESRLHHHARRGSIARISDLLHSTATSFLIDAFVFPGNSGGPVVSALSGMGAALQGTKVQDHVYLIGSMPKRRTIPCRTFRCRSRIQTAGKCRTRRSPPCGLH